MGILRQIYVRMTGEQQLLNENKERSGDTRAIRQNRTHRKSEADKQVAPAPTKLGGPPAVKTAEEDESRRRSSRVNNSSREEELSAQRRKKKKKFKVYGVSNINPYDWPEKIESVSIPWTATYNRRIESIEGDGLRHYRWVRENIQRTNSYQVVEREWLVGFNRDFGNSTTLFATPKHTLPGVITAFNWYFHQSSIGVTGQSVAGAVYHSEKSIIASTPQLSPHSSGWFNNKQTMTVNDKPLTSSDGRYIYHSTWYVAGQASTSFYNISSKVLFTGYTIFNPPLTVRDEFPSETIDIDGFTYHGHKIQKTIFGIQQGTSTYFSLGDSLRYFRDVRGLYWRYDTQTPNAVPELTVKDLSYPGDGTTADRRNVLSNFLDNLNPSDPYYKLWKFLYASNYSYSYNFLNSLTSQIEHSLTYLRWPPNLVYYPDTGQALFTNRLFNNGLFDTNFTVYSKTVATGLETYQMMHLFPYLTQSDNSHQNMLANGWKVESVDFYTNSFLDPNFRVAHRPT